MLASKYKFRFTRTAGLAAKSREEPYIQISVIKFYDKAGVRLRPVEVTNPGGSSPEAETPSELLNDSVYTKWLDFKFMNKQASELVFTFEGPVSVYKYELFTANDCELRDPESWELFASSGDSWRSIDKRSGVSTDTARYSLIGTFHVSEEEPEFGPDGGLETKTDETSPVVHDDVKATKSLKGKYFKFVFTETSDSSYDTNIQLSLIKFWTTDEKECSPRDVENPGGRSPDEEQPFNLLDGRTYTKWLDFEFKTGKSELIFEFEDAILLEKYSFFTANDFSERDPKSWKLYASTNKRSWKLIDERSDLPRHWERYSLLGQFEIDANKASSDDSKDSVLEKISLETQERLSTKFLKFSFTELQGYEPYIQLSSIRFYHGHTEVIPVAVSNPDGSSPDAEQSHNLLDPSLGTKWLDFRFKEHDPFRSVLVFEFETPVFITSYKIFTANDFEGRDPKSWKVEGSKDRETWTAVDSRPGQKPVVERFALLGKYAPQSVLTALISSMKDKKKPAETAPKSPGS